jgi:hypothetical protein
LSVPTDQHSTSTLREKRRPSTKGPRSAEQPSDLTFGPTLDPRSTHARSNTLLPLLGELLDHTVGIDVGPTLGSLGTHRRGSEPHSRPRARLAAGLRACRHRRRTSTRTYTPRRERLRPSKDRGRRNSRRPDVSGPIGTHADPRSEKLLGPLLGELLSDSHCIVTSDPRSTHARDPQTEPHSGPRARTRSNHARTRVCRHRRRTSTGPTLRREQCPTEGTVARREQRRTRRARTHVRPTLGLHARRHVSDRCLASSDSHTGIDVGPTRSTHARTHRRTALPVSRARLKLRKSPFRLSASPSDQHSDPHWRERRPPTGRTAARRNSCRDLTCLDSRIDPRWGPTLRDYRCWTAAWRAARFTP